MPKWNYVINRKKITKVLVKEICKLAHFSIKQNGVFRVVVPGGLSYKDVFIGISKLDLAWNKWHFYITDERVLPINHKNRNDTMLRKLLLDSIQIPKRNINLFDFNKGIKHSVRQYYSKIEKINNFDLVLLGVGLDGHVASLFPGCKPQNNKEVIIEKLAPKLPKIRISLSLSRLNKSMNIFKLIVGKEKKVIIKALKSNKDIPANNISCKNEKIFTLSSNKFL